MKKPDERELPLAEPPEREVDLAELLEMTSIASPPVSTRIDGVVVGTLVSFASGKPRVTHPFSGGAELEARAIVAMSEADGGREVALLFEAGDPSRPIVMGLMFEAANAAIPLPTEPVTVHRDEETVTISAQREIVLQCGKASITLTRAGKILIRGAYLSSRASGVNRIQGGAVEIN
jgi:hypothetical protein